MKTLILFCVLGLILGCQRESAPPVHWEYQEFKFQAAHHNSVMGWDEIYRLIYSDMPKDWQNDPAQPYIPKPILSQPIRCRELSELMNCLGSEGWELVSQNGDKYMVKRQSSAKHSHSGFLVEMDIEKPGETK